jgi:hypothetical protein
MFKSCGAAMALPFDVDWRSFWLGFAVVAVPAFLLFVFGIWSKPVPSPFKPQTVLLTTKKTPWQVVMGWLGSVLIMVAVGIALAAVVIVLFLGGELAEMWWLIVVAAVCLLTGVLLRALFG